MSCPESRGVSQDERPEEGMRRGRRRSGFITRIKKTGKLDSCTGMQLINVFIVYMLTYNSQSSNCIWNVQRALKATTLWSIDLIGSSEMNCRRSIHEIL